MGFSLFVGKFPFAGKWIWDMLIVFWLFCCCSAVVVDVRNTTLRPHYWEYLEVDPAQRGNFFFSNFSLPHPYPGARESTAVRRVLPHPSLFLYFGGNGWVPVVNSALLADAWLYNTSANVWEYVDSSGDGATKTLDTTGSVNGTLSFPGGRWGHRMVSGVVDVVYLCGLC